ncbi:hypothetical protein BAOM_3105 [Peribacillus asahii]|uniref:Uncharacterized protein n=1 Tax=Peribacillus asahii TaxID=228899 RepID=A0A3T0KU39_9BACI|nr:hypothetical protein [Peribacillus asahii]AZV43714.1 hypothetical protein BAOM_3105 [Peribacillus asahii]
MTTNKPTKKPCLKCEKDKPITKDFYLSNSTNHADSRYPICKTCIKNNLKLDEPMSQEAIESLKNVLIEMNRPFLFSQWTTSVEESSRTGRELFGMYIKNISMPQYRDYSWKDSEFEPNLPSTENKVEVEVINKSNKKENEEIVVIDTRDKEDVIRMLGYDPFEHENPNDKKHLYSRLVDFLDESTLEDGFKLQAVIEIVIGFNQIDKINHAITNITNDIDRLSDKSGGIKSLIDSKKNILASLIKLAEENGISVKHNTQKSKGAGTLTGIIKTLQEKGIEQGELNLYDIETAQGIRQVADLSNQSIMAQLQFDENDYTSMLMEQREMIQELDAKVTKLEEENRLLKKELIRYKQSDGDSDE